MQFFYYVTSEVQVTTWDQGPASDVTASWDWTLTCRVWGGPQVESELLCRDFPDGPVAKTLLPVQGPGFHPWLEN